MLAEALSGVQDGRHTCATNIDRFKNYNNLNYEDHINRGTVYVDDVFTETDSVYWSDFTHANSND